jgi:hypothetical protein
MANPTTARCAPRADANECKPKAKGCPDCGALECLCRPRFFAGQLLTEQDLNRLDQYIKKKHRLQNRNLHGWGVVNGLLAVCDPCGDVKLTPGYALSPCGDDIVVCEETAVNLCELIRRCRRADPRPCRPHSAPPRDDCRELEEDWILTIRPREWTTQGVTPLTAAACAAACGCPPDDAASRLKPRGAPVSCEPSVVCEGFEFGVYRAPEPEPRDPIGVTDRQPRLFNADSDLWQQFLCCAQPLFDAIPLMPRQPQNDNQQPDRAALANWCCRFRAALLDHFSTQRNVRCEIIDALRAVVCPSATQLEGFELAWTRALLDLAAIFFEGLKNCLCLALLPPAPVATDDDRVPLARIRIRASDCRVLSICNWTTERRFVITWPTVGYWVGVTGLGKALHEAIETACCASLLGIFDDVLDQTDSTAPQGGFVPGDNFSGAGVGAVAADTGGSPLTAGLNLASGVFASRAGASSRAEAAAELVARMRARGDTTLQLGAVLNAVSSRFRLPTNDAPLSSLERDNLPVLLAAELFGRPLLDEWQGVFAGVTVRGLTDAASPTAATADSGNLAAMTETLTRLQARVDAQDVELAALRQRIDRG